MHHVCILTPQGCKAVGLISQQFALSAVVSDWLIPLLPGGQHVRLRACQHLQVEPVGKEVTWLLETLPSAAMQEIEWYAQPGMIIALCCIVPYIFLN